MAKSDVDLTEELNNIYNHMGIPDPGELKIQVNRMQPVHSKGIKISGYLKTFYLPTSIPEVIEQIGMEFGGGEYQCRIIDGEGKYVKSKTFQISGLPKVPEPKSPVATPVEEPKTFWHPLKPNDETAPIPTKDEMRKFLIRRSLALLDQPGSNQLETLKFLKELYQTERK